MVAAGASGPVVVTGGAGAIGAVAGTYALAWGVAQLATGALSDRIGRKPLIVAGLVVNGAGLLTAATARSWPTWMGPPW